MKKAWQDPIGTIRDICPGEPAESYHPDVAAFYETDVPDGVVNGATLVAGEWVNPLPPAPPAPPTQAELDAIAAADYQAKVPQSVTMRQASIAMELAGLLDDVEIIVATLPRIYQIEWQRASTVQRDNPLVEMVRKQQGMTTEQIDALFVQAAML